MCRWSEEKLVLLRLFGSSDAVCIVVQAALHAYLLIMLQVVRR